MGGGLVVGVLAWVLWPTADVEPPRARVYVDRTVCLLTGESGLRGAEAAPLWTAIIDAAAAVRVRAQHTAVDGPQTAQNAATYINGIAGGQCDVLFVVGSAQVEAAAQRASAYPEVRFYTVADVRETSNLSRVEGDVGGAVTKIVNDLAAGS